MSTSGAADPRPTAPPAPALRATGPPSPADSPAPPEPTLAELAAAVDEATAGLAGLDPEARRAAEAVKAAIEAFHRPALVHLVKTLRADPRGKELLFELVDDPGVKAVFALHGIIRPDPATRAQRALDSVRPYLQSHGGDVELVAVTGEVASVRLQGSCNGCSMSAVTLQEMVTEALVNGVDEIGRVEVLDDQPTTAFIPVTSVGRRPADTGWVEGPALDRVPPGTMARFDTEVGGRPASFIVTNTAQRVAVFRNACAHQGRELDGGMLDDGVLVCPWHGFRFDAASGECVSAPGAQLDAVPARIEGGHVWLRASGG